MKKRPWFDDVKKYYVFRSLNKRFLIPVWVLAMLDGGLTADQVALIAALAAVLTLVMEVPSGAISDALGHKRTLFLAMIGQGAGMLLFIGGNFWWFLAASLTYWGMGTFMTGTHRALIYERLIELKQEGLYQKFMGRARVISSAWSMLMVASAGVVYAFSSSLAFVIAALLFWAGGVVVASMQEAKRPRSVKKEEGYLQVFRHFKQAMTNLKKDPRLFWLIVSSSIIFGVTFSMEEVQQIIFEQVGLAAAMIGFIYGAKRAVAMVFATFMHRLSSWLTPVSTLMLMLGLTLVYLFGFGLVDDQVMIILISLTTPVVLVIHDIVIGDYKNRLIPTGSRATTLSMGNFISGVLKIVLLGGTTAIAYFASVELAHLVVAGLLIFSAVYLLPMTARAFRA